MACVRIALVTTVLAALTLGTLGSAPAGAGPAPRPAPPARAAATVLGQSGAPIVCNTAVPAAVVLTTEGAGGASYTAASSGVLTSFTHQANNVTGQVRAIVLGPGPSAGQRSVAAKSPKFSLARSTTNTFAVRLPIRAGQQLALGYTASGMACATAGVAGDVTAVATGFDPDTSATFTPAGTLSPGSPRPNISATLEPDADGDGFGDVTQDACPRSALTQVACPEPDTTITKRPKRYRANPKVKLKFTSSIEGSSFQCRRDSRKWRTCASPYKVRLRAGAHRLRVRALSPAGIPDPKPAKVKVTITR